MRQRRTLSSVLWGTMIAVLAIMLLAWLGRPAPADPTPPRTQNVKPATDLERLQHDLKQAYDLDHVSPSPSSSSGGGGWGAD